MKKVVFKIIKKTVKDNTRVGSMYCFKNCEANAN